MSAVPATRVQNGAFSLTLRRDVSEIAVALSDNVPGGVGHDGCGLELRLDDLQGVRAGRD